MAPFLYPSFYDSCHPAVTAGQNALKHRQVSLMVIVF